MAPRREELTEYVAHSRAVQRGLRWLLTAGLVLAFLLLVGGAGGGAVAVVVALTVGISGIGFWITHGHIADFDQQLRKRRQ